MKETDKITELAHRMSDKIDVTLWWVNGTIDTYVEVIDFKKEPPELLVVPVVPPVSPNEVFNHPFRYHADSPTLELEPVDGRSQE